MPAKGSALTGDNPLFPGTVVLIPVKDFRTAKHRLSSILNAAERSRLARAMADSVVLAADPLDVVAICRAASQPAQTATLETGSDSDQSATNWATQRGIQVIPDTGLGLSHAVGSAATQVCARGAREVIVAHADLPLAADLQALSGFPGITIVPDRHRQGTNIICLPGEILGSSESSFEFSYGPGSFERHRARAKGTGVPCRIVDDPRLTCDIDEPADIEYLIRMLGGGGPSDNGSAQNQIRLLPDDLGWLREVLSRQGNPAGRSHAAS